MIRQETLTSKQDELTRCITSRESKLSELYHATASYLKTARAHNKDLNNAKYVDDGEIPFLEANRLSNGRFFDQSTLPSLYGAHLTQNFPYIKSTIHYSPRSSTNLVRAVEDGVQRSAKLSNKVIHDSDQACARSIEQVSGNSLPQHGGASSKSGELYNWIAEKPSPSHGESDTYHEHLRPREVNSNLVANYAQAEVSTSFEISSFNASPPKLKSEKQSGTASQAPVHNSTQAIPSTTEDAPAKPAAAPLDAALSRMPASCVTLQSSKEQIQRPGLEDLQDQGSGASQVQSLEPPTESIKLLNTRGERKLDAGDLCSIKLEDRSIQEASKGSILPSTDLNILHTSTPRSPLTYSLDNLGTAPFEIATNHDTDPRLRLEAPPAESKNDCPPSASTTLEKSQLESPKHMQLSNQPSIVNKNRILIPSFPNLTEVAPSVPGQVGHGESDIRYIGPALQTPIVASNLDQQVTASPRLGDIEKFSKRATVGLGGQVFLSTAGNPPQDLSNNRGPPIRIDTGAPPTAQVQKAFSSKKTTPLSAASPHTQASLPAPQKSSSIAVQSPPERMMTRVLSGANRHKSLSEILGETPRSIIGDKIHERAYNEYQREDNGIQSPRSASANIAPDPTTFKQGLNELKGKDRSKLSTVVFSRQQPSNASRYLDSQLRFADSLETHLQKKDYFLPLFTLQAASPPHSRPLHSLITSAHKTLSTSNHYTDFHERQNCRILERIFQLQVGDRWSLRQKKRSLEPERPTTHWDVLISHMKWMRTDFREERKWKIAAAKLLADFCAEWVRSSAKVRMGLQIRIRHSRSSAEERMAFAPTPDLLPPTEDDSSVSTGYDSPRLELPQENAPAAIFSLGSEIVCFGVDKTPVSEKLLLELPLYHPSLDYEDAAVQGRSIEPDASWRTPLITLSKFAQGKLISHEQGPPRKKSRYNYDDYDTSGSETTNKLLASMEQGGDVMEPEQEDVALFNLEHKHTRDRIHAGHAFRPPTEYLMPSQSFFETRHSSLWTHSEDDELRRLVREFAYNWSLISNCLSSPSRYTSEAERRTPWECFERWVNLEGLPTEMSKTQYFKAYQSRLQAAQKTIETQQAMQQNQSNGTALLNNRLRKTTQPCQIERKKSNRHIHIVDAMRKLAKKREATVQKQQLVAGVAAMRKSNETVQPRRTMTTPHEMSRLKFEREIKNAEKQAESKLRHRDQQKVALGQKPNPQYGQQMHVSDMHTGRLSVSGSANGSSPNTNSPLPNCQTHSNPPNQVRSIPPMSGAVNGSQSNGAHTPSLQGVPHAPMQGHLPPMHRRAPPQMASDSMRIYQEASRVQEQQRYLHQRHQQHPQPNGQPGNSASPNMGHPNLIPPNNPAIPTSMQGRSGSPSMNGVSAPAGSLSSPQMTNHSQPQRLSSGVVPTINHIQNSLKNRNPQASPEMIDRMTTETLDHHYRVTQSSVTAAAAMQAAAGPNLSTLQNNMNINLLSPPLQQQQQQQQSSILSGLSNTSALSREHYAQLLRSQQSQQIRATTMNGVRAGSRSATPQTHPQSHHRSGSNQGGPPPSRSPRPTQAQMAGGQ